MNFEQNGTKPNYGIEIFTMFKFINYIELLSKHPNGLSRAEIRNMVPISSTPEMNCTEILYDTGFITNAEILKGKKFKLTQKGRQLWKIMQALDIFINQSATETIVSEKDLQYLNDVIEILQNFSNKLETKKKQDETLESLF